MIVHATLWKRVNPWRLQQGGRNALVNLVSDFRAAVSDGTRFVKKCNSAAEREISPRRTVSLEPSVSS
jgi:hypothetical protein